VRVLVIGKGGQLARTLRNTTLQSGVEMLFAGRPECDLRTPGSAAQTIEQAKPDCIINTAAYTAVDLAESEPELAFAINSRGAGEIADAAEAVGARMVHISTDYVFNGYSTRPLTEGSPTGPLNVYGQSKLAGEEAVRQASPDALIVRTSWLYSPYGGNFVSTVLRLAAERDELRIVDDQIGCPTSASDLAGALVALAERWSQDDGTGLGETYHFAGREHCSWADFARGIIDESVGLGGKLARVLPIATADYPTPAIRPAYTVLDCSKFDRDFGFPRLDWQTAVRSVVAELMGAA
jgi:dTDP-4-dehydrorhamnose reductase